MKKFLQTNSFFLGCFLFFIILGAVLLFQIEKPDSILFFSERRTPFFDAFFSYATKMGEELTYVIFLILFLFIKIRHSILIPVVGFLVTGISYVTKTFFAHNRPLVFLENMGIDKQINYVEGIELYVGPTSFPSGHTMSAFALYGLVAFLISGKKIGGVFLFVMALLIGVSRIYLVQHFFQDVYFGAIFGVGIATVLYFVQKQIKLDDTHWLNHSILDLKKKNLKNQNQKLNQNQNP